MRKRAALAAGRIGNEQAVAGLVNLLQHDDEQNVRAMAAPKPAEALITASELAARLGVDRSWIYVNAGSLGGQQRRPGTAPADLGNRLTQLRKEWLGQPAADRGEYVCGWLPPRRAA